MKKKIPYHIGIIPDGNRRWAQSRGLEKKAGYEFGLEPGLKVLHAAKEAGVEEITYYGFTTDNCKRPKEQYEAFKDACVKAVELITKDGADLLVLGNTFSKCFPEELMSYSKRTSVNGGGIKVNMLINYGWQWDLAHVAVDGHPYSWDISRMDMIIRWGGMRRLSGFLPLQSVYSDFYVVDSYWPDYKDIDFFNALDWYSKQDVTLGG